MTNKEKFKLFIVVLSLACLTGCDSMSRQEVIEATKECESAKMRAKIIHNPWWGTGIIDVQCFIKEASNE